ncbi:hypothetical protein [Sorangium sp. So ce362]|uniref:hypothetical protein n=1 Tax=Sorangium sp. So ce362 TaxID=3133303 RepID=UPI003F5F8E66
MSYAETRFGFQAPHVFYVDATHDTLRVASKAGSSWSAMPPGVARRRRPCRRGPS